MKNIQQIKHNQKGQGAIEYLLIIGAAILVVAIVIIAITNVSNTGRQQVPDNSNAYSRLETLLSTVNTYTPNSLNAQSWRGTSINVSETAFIKTSFQTTANNSTEKNNLSIIDTSYVSQASAGGPSCAGRTLVGSCTGLAQSPCNNSYTTTTACFWNGLSCIATAPCGLYAGQSFSYRLNESPSTISKIDIIIWTMVSSSSGELKLYAWNENTLTYNYLASLNPITPIKQSFAASITSNIPNYISSTNDLLLLAVNQNPTGDNLIVDYAGITVTAN